MANTSDDRYVKIDIDKDISDVQVNIEKMLWWSTFKIRVYYVLMVLFAIDFVVHVVEDYQKDKRIVVSCQGASDMCNRIREAPYGTILVAKAGETFWPERGGTLEIRDFPEESSRGHRRSMNICVLQRLTAVDYSDPVFLARVEDLITPRSPKYAEMIERCGGEKTPQG